MSKFRRILIPLAAGLTGVFLLSGLYFGIVSWAESPNHAVDLFWKDRWIVIPIIVGFGVQSALFMILERQLSIPVSNAGPSRIMTGASGTSSTIAMVACCAHHLTELLPILGLSAAATFLAEYQAAFMLMSLGMTIVGIAVISNILLRERRKNAHLLSCAVALEAE